VLHWSFIHSLRRVINDIWRRLFSVPIEGFLLICHLLRNRFFRHISSCIPAGTWGRGSPCGRRLEVEAARAPSIAPEKFSFVRAVNGTNEATREEVDSRRLEGDFLAAAEGLNIFQGHGFQDESEEEIHSARRDERHHIRSIALHHSTGKRKTDEVAGSGDTSELFSRLLNPAVVPRHCPPTHREPRAKKVPLVAGTSCTPRTVQHTRLWRL
jgi:hypothetical protein